SSSALSTASVWSATRRWSHAPRAPKFSSTASRLSFAATAAAGSRPRSSGRCSPGRPSADTASSSPIRRKETRRCGRSTRSSVTGRGRPGFSFVAKPYRLSRDRGDVASGARRLGLLFFQGGFLMAQIESRARATSDPEARREALKRLQDENVDFLLLWFTDIEGHLKSFAVTPSEVEAALDDGMGFDGSSITGFNAIEESDMVAIPDPATFQLMPAREGEMKMARMICDIVTPDGKPYEGDPRYVLRRALERMRALGFDTFNVGPELEYFLFR